MLIHPGRGLLSFPYPNQKFLLILLSQHPWRLNRLPLAFTWYGLTPGPLFSPELSYQFLHWSPSLHFYYPPPRTPSCLFSKQIQASYCFLYLKYFNGSHYLKRLKAKFQSSLPEAFIPPYPSAPKCPILTP